MGLIFFNLMIFTVTLTAFLLLVFGITFIKAKRQNKDSNIKRASGIWPTVLGAILIPLFLALDINFIVREASEGANVIGNGTILIGSFFIWPIVLIVDSGVLFFYLYNAIHFMRMGKDRRTKEIVAIDHYVFGLLLLILGITYIVSALGATFIPPSFLG